MSDTSAIIRVENVSKRFTRGQAKAGDLRERFTRLGGGRRAASADFWALKNVSFSLSPGRTLGIVGHNGSGKSTLLKMLTGILKPTSGRIQIGGRVGALIEVGAGFHPDLSGRENIYLNGSILGLSRREIAGKFDDIVSFAGLEQFIDTPVKRYSSGMYMRLGFAIAAHTAPDILLIDEVLAVGDALFQRRCIRHLKEFVKQGGTVVFVSHAAGQVAEMCESCLWLDHGEARHLGPTGEVIDRYMALVSEREEEDIRRLYPAEWESRETERLAAEEAERLAQEEAERLERAEIERRVNLRRARPDDPHACRLNGVTLRDARGVARTRFHAGDAVRVEIGYTFGRALPDPVFGIDIFRDDGLHMFTTSNYDHQVSLKYLLPAGTVALDVPMLGLNEGIYRIQVNLFAESTSPQWYDRPEDEIPEAVTFEVSAGRFANGCVYLPTSWAAPDTEDGDSAVAVQTGPGGGEKALQHG